MLVKVTNMGAELQSQNRVDVCYGKTFGLGAPWVEPGMLCPKFRKSSRKTNFVQLMYKIINLIINRKRKFQNSNAGAKQKLILPSIAVPALPL